MRSSRGWIVWMVGLAVLSGLMFALSEINKPKFEIFPTSLSTDPGGALGLYKLVEASGGKVRRLFSEPADKDTELDTVVLFVSDNRQVVPDYEDFGRPLNAGREYERALKNAKQFVLIEIPKELPKGDSFISVPTESQIPAFKAIKKLCPPPVTDETEDRAVILRTSNSSPVVTYYTEGGKDYYTIAGGQMLLNRFIRKEDNAKLAASLILSITPSGGTIAFPEYLYGVRKSENIFTRMGPTYSATLIQLLFMFVLLVYALGKRFGYPETDVPPKPGTARFFQAMGDAYRRRRCTDIALDSTIDRAMRAACRKYAIRADIPRVERLARVPGPLGVVMREAALIAPTRPHAADATLLIARIEEELKRIS